MVSSALSEGNGWCLLDFKTRHRRFRRTRSPPRLGNALSFLSLGCVASSDFGRNAIMAKRVVFCADGTWQDSLNDTNVYRLYKALTVSSGDLLAFPQPALKSAFVT